MPRVVGRALEEHKWVREQEKTAGAVQKATETGR